MKAQCNRNYTNSRPPTLHTNTRLLGVLELFDLPANRTYSVQEAFVVGDDH